MVRLLTGSRGRVSSCLSLLSVARRKRVTDTDLRLKSLVEHWSVVEFPVLVLLPGDEPGFVGVLAVLALTVDVVGFGDALLVVAPILIRLGVLVVGHGWLTFVRR